MPSSAAQWTGTDVPARLDRLPWSRWHWLVVVALGVEAEGQSPKSITSRCRRGSRGRRHR